MHLIIVVRLLLDDDPIAKKNTYTYEKKIPIELATYIYSTI